jgi:hypothetical protein
MAACPIRSSCSGKRPCFGRASAEVTRASPWGWWSQSARASAWRSPRRSLVRLVGVDGQEAARGYGEQAVCGHQTDVDFVWRGSSPGWVVDNVGFMARKSVGARVARSTAIDQCPDAPSPKARLLDKPCKGHDVRIRHHRDQ